MYRYCSIFKAFSRIELIYRIYVHTETCTYIQMLDALEAVQNVKKCIYKYMYFYANYKYTPISVPILKSTVKMFW